MNNFIAGYFVSCPVLTLDYKIGTMIMKSSFGAKSLTSLPVKDLVPNFRNAVSGQY